MDASREPQGLRTLGLIGGLGVGATILYYEWLVEAMKQRGLSLRLVIAHADFEQALSLVSANRLDELAEYLADLANRLAAAGADICVIPAITPHICIDGILRRSKRPFVSLLDVTAQAVASRGLRRVALFGTRFSIERDLFGALKGVEIVRPRPAEIDTIHDIYLSVVRTGHSDDKQREALRAIAATLLTRDGVEAIILAGTELAIVFDKDNPAGFPAIDCASLHIQAIMRALIAA